MAKNKIKRSIISSVENKNSANELSNIVSEINENYQIISELIKNENISAEILSAVNSEAYSYPPAVYAQPIYEASAYEHQDTASDISDLRQLIEELNKPIQLVLNGDVIGETAMNYREQYKRTTRT